MPATLETSKTNTGSGDPVILRERADPLVQVDRGHLYTKDVLGVTELFYIDPDPGTPVQITSGGSVAAGGPGSDTTAFHQGGDAFGAAAIIGTNDAFDLSFETVGVIRATLKGSGGFHFNLIAPATPANQTLAFYRGASLRAQMGLEGAAGQNSPGSAIDDFVVRLDTTARKFIVTAGGGVSALTVTNTQTTVIGGANALRVRGDGIAQANSSVLFTDKNGVAKTAIGYGESGGHVTGGDVGGYGGIVNSVNLPFHFSLDGTTNRNWYTRVVSGVPSIGTQQSAAFAIETGSMERARFLSTGEFLVNRTTTIGDGRVQIRATGAGERALFLDSSPANNQTSMIWTDDGSFVFNVGFSKTASAIISGGGVGIHVRNFAAHPWKWALDGTDAVDMAWSVSAGVLTIETGTAMAMELKAATSLDLFGGGSQRIRVSGTGIGFYGVAPVAQAAKINDPAGGATVDAEARTAINSLIDVLEGLGASASV